MTDEVSRNERIKEASNYLRGTLAEGMAEEVTAIAAAEGWPIPGDAPAARVARSAKLRHQPSILQDLEAGRMMEVEAMLRAPLRIAREAGVAVPTLALMVALATRAAIAAGLYILTEDAA